MKEDGGAACEVLEKQTLSQHRLCDILNEEPLKSNLSFTGTIDTGQMGLRNQW